MLQTVPATAGDVATVPGSRYGLGIGAVGRDGRTTVVLSIGSNVDDPVLAAEYAFVDHVMSAPG